MDYFPSVRDFALAFPGAREDHPWGPEPVVFKNAAGKVFVFTSPPGAEPAQLTVKLSPDEAGAALTLPFVAVARYVGRYNWVTATVTTDAELDISLEWVRRSFELVARSKTRG